MSVIPTSSYRFLAQQTQGVSNLLGIVTGLDRVDSPSQVWLEQMARWELPTDLMGGTLQMRACGMKWLPKEPKELWDKYVIRLSRAVLYNGFKSAIRRVVGKPFSREVTVTGLPPALESMLKNVDLQGSTVTQFAKRLMKDAAVYGKTHFYVDYPRTGGNQTLRDEITGEVRPYFIHIPATDVIDATPEIDPATGEEYPAVIRVKDKYWQREGKWGSRLVDRTRVYTPGQVDTYESANNEEPRLVDSSTVLVKGKTPTRIPLVIIYFEKEDFFSASPPFEDLAWVNLAHWQSSADQRNALRFGRIGILLAKGFSTAEVEKGIDITPNMAQMSVSPDADMKYVEQSGAALQAGERDLEKLEKQMETMGTQPFIERTRDTTATGKRLDEGATDSQVQSWIRAIEGGLERGFELAADYMGITLPEDFCVDVFSEFSLVTAADTDIDHILAMRSAVPPLISAKTALLEVQRRNLISDDIDVDAELEDIDQEMLDSVKNAPPLDPNADPNADPSADPNANPFPPKPGDPTSRENVPGDVNA